MWTTPSLKDEIINMLAGAVPWIAILCLGGAYVAYPYGALAIVQVLACVVAFGLAGSVLVPVAFRVIGGMAGLVARPFVWMQDRRRRRFQRAVEEMRAQRSDRVTVNPRAFRDWPLPPT